MILSSIQSLVRLPPLSRLPVVSNVLHSGLACFLHSVGQLAPSLFLKIVRFRGLVLDAGWTSFCPGYFVGGNACLILHHNRRQTLSTCASIHRPQFALSSRVVTRPHCVQIYPESVRPLRAALWSLCERPVTHLPCVQCFEYQWIILTWITSYIGVVSDIFYPLLSLPQFFIVNDLGLHILQWRISHFPRGQLDFAVMLTTVLSCLWEKEQL